MPSRHLYSLFLPAWAVRGRVCRLWNVFTAQNALVCPVDGGMLAACDLTPAGASTIFTCDMRLTAVSSRAPTQILHTSHVRGKQWLVQFFFIFFLVVIFLCTIITHRHFLLVITLATIAVSHNAAALNTQDVFNSTAKRFGAIHALPRHSASSMPRPNDMAGSSTIKIQSFNAREPHRLQHLFTAERKRIELSLQRLPERPWPTPNRSLHRWLDIQCHSRRRGHTWRWIMPTLTLLRQRANLPCHQEHDRRMSQDTYL